MNKIELINAVAEKAGMTKVDARQGRNPRTGKNIKIPAKKVVRFKPAVNILK